MSIKSSKMLGILLVVFTLCIGVFHLNADVSFPVQSSMTMQSDDPVKARLVHEEDSVQPGRSFWLALHLTLEEGWHTYWKNPGETGMGPQIKWTLPEGFRIEAIHWPVPHKLNLNSGIAFGYDDEVILLAQVIPPSSVHNPIEIGAHVKWIVCDESSCLPGGAKLTASIPVNSHAPQLHPDHTEIFSRGREALPNHTNYEKVRVTRTKHNGFLLEVESSNDFIGVEFFPEDADQVDSSAKPAIARDKEKPNVHKITLKGSEHQKKKSMLKGVLVLSKTADTSQYDEAIDIQHPIANDPSNETILAYNNTPADTSAKFSGIEAESGGFWLAISFAFLGGLILNLMPCVLPVISVKMLSFVKLSGQKRSLIFRHGLAFAGGVLVSFWILAGTLLLLQAYGQTAGWGFQLQKPLFVAILATVFFVFGLSLFGLFELGIGLASFAGQAQSGKSSQGLSSSFFSGVLATAVATPCTGPFLGTAMGLAFTMPAPLTLLIFTSLALGMSSPYLLIGAFPGFLKFLPKPGNWMIVFKQLMGFLMIATVIWLLRVFGAQTGNDGMIQILSGFLLIAAACWVYGQWSTPLSKKMTRRIALLFVIALTALGGAFVHKAAKQRNDQIAMNADGWEPFSRERVAELQAQGTPVFIDFTAKWCATCEANHIILTTDSVEKKFSDLGVVKMKADWTNEDPIIAEELRKFGRNSVPLYILYSDQANKPPAILPQLLTPDIVISHLDQVAER